MPPFFKDASTAKGLGRPDAVVAGASAVSVEGGVVFCTLGIAAAVGVTGITKLVFAPAARPAATVQVTVWPAAVQPAGKTLRVSRINRGKIRGSFLISAYAKVDGKREYLGTRPILSRWHVEGCMNCQTHLEATATFKLPLNADNSAIDEGTIEVEVQTRDTVLKRPEGAKLLNSSNAVAADVPFKLETY